MNHSNMHELVSQAIQERRLLRIREKGQNFDIELEPYILGDDFLQKPFVWGYVPFNKLFYKFYFEFAERINKADQTFTPQPNLQYYFSESEDHYLRLEPIDCWVTHGPLPKADWGGRVLADSLLLVQRDMVRLKLNRTAIL